jgi:thiamine biosynthesis lipoprotein ApbE
MVVPASGRPLRTRYAVSVVAKSATASDALATTLLLLGPEKGEAAIKGLPDVAAIWISGDGQKTIAGGGFTFSKTDSRSRTEESNVENKTVTKPK